MASLADPSDIAAFLNAHEAIDEPTLFAVGDEVGAWRIVAFFRRGGSGEVYRVVHRELGFDAAMKVLSRADEAEKVRLRREACALVGCRHPSSPRFFDYGEKDGCAYLVIDSPESVRAAGRTHHRVTVLTFAQILLLILLLTAAGWAGWSYALHAAR